MPLKPGLAAGAIAGAVGALAIDAASYGDILLRGRPPSALPGEASRTMVARLGIRLGDNGSDAARHRADALGALLGYGTGIAMGSVYGLLARRSPGGRWRGLALGAAAMVPSNFSLVVSGLTDPRTWGLAGWLADIVPHLAYGFATAGTYRAITVKSR
jgi:hypothetical protein